MINLLGLIEMYNTFNTQTVYHDVAACLLTHFDKLEKMTAAEIADLCHISPSTLQRFFKKMNYPMTVSKLPEIFTTLKWPIIMKVPICLLVEILETHSRIISVI